MAKKQTIYVVITPGRVFVFGNFDLANKFYMRAIKLPSMKNKPVELINAKVFTGRKFKLERVKEREAEFQEKQQRELEELSACF